MTLLAQLIFRRDTIAEPDMLPQKEQKHADWQGRKSPDFCVNVQQSGVADLSPQPDPIRPKAIPRQVMEAALGWLTPYEQLVVLRKKAEYKAWERFRDSLMRRWSNLNVIVSRTFL